MRSKLLILTFLSLFFGARSAFAVAPSITNAPSTINTDTAFSLTTTMSGLSNNAVYRLRIALAPQGTSNYFGSTFNGTSWYNGTPSPINYSNFLSITTDSTGSWSGDVQGKVESSDPNFSGSSTTYNLKIGRYTETGSSPTWSSPLSIALIAPSPTSTPPPSSTPTATPSDIPQTTSSFTISNTPAQINSDHSFSVNINLSMPNSQNTDYYLKGGFKKADGTRYFGLTKIGSSWIEYGDDYSNQYKITTDSSGNWSGNIEVKPNILDNDYKGSGEYIFKVGRLTATGSGPTWSNNEVIIKINDTGNTPSNSPSPQSTTKTSPSASSTKLKALTPKSTPSIASSYQIASVAGATTSATPEGKVEVKNQKQINPIIWIGLVFIFAGIGLIGYIYLKKNAKI